MGRAGRKRVEDNFDIISMVRQVEEVYLNILEG